MIKKLGFILFLLFLASPCLAQDDDEIISFAEEVFPPHIHEYPLIFIREEKYLNHNFYRKPDLQEFIVSQKKRGLKHHKVVTGYFNGAHYPQEEYRYLVLGRIDTVKSYTTRNMTVRIFMSYYFHDRFDSTDYEPFGRITYNRRTEFLGSWQYASQKKFFKELTKTIDSLRKKGAEKTYDKALRKDNTNRFFSKAGLVLLVAAGISIIPLSIIF